METKSKGKTSDAISKLINLEVEAVIIVISIFGYFLWKLITLSKGLWINE